VILNKEKAAAIIDHTFLKPDGSLEDIKQLCQEAKKFHFASVAIAPAFVEIAKDELQNTEIDVDVAIGFPLGYTTTENKIHETKDALQKGATEFDMVVNVSAVKDKRWDYIKEEINSVAEVTGNFIFKVIFETCYLTDDEIKKLTELCSNIIGVDFIKTSTGFGTAGATEKHVSLMKKNARPNLGIKASGGIKNLDHFKKMINSGATRIGTSSGVKIINQI